MNDKKFKKYHPVDKEELTIEERRHCVELAGWDEEEMPLEGFEDYFLK